MEADNLGESGLQRSEVMLTGLRISPGLGMGKAWIAGDLLRLGADGRRIKPHEIEHEGNVGVYEDVELTMENGADGVGLFRIEQLSHGNSRPPNKNSSKNSVMSRLRFVISQCRFER